MTTQINSYVRYPDNCPPVRVGVSVKVRVIFRVGGQLDNCPGRRLPPWLELGFELGLVLGLGAILLGGNCSRTLMSLLCLYSLKALEKLWFSDVFSGYRKKSVA